MLKPLTFVWIMTNCGKHLKMGSPDHFTCLLRSLYLGQDATVRTLYGTTDWLGIKQGIQQSRLLSPCLFSFYAERIMQNTGLDELQAEIKIAKRNQQPQIYG